MSSEDYNEERKNVYKMLSDRELEKIDPSLRYRLNEQVDRLLNAVCLLRHAIDIGIPWMNYAADQNLQINGSDRSAVDDLGKVMLIVESLDSGFVLDKKEVDKMLEEETLKEVDIN